MQEIQKGKIVKKNKKKVLFWLKIRQNKVFCGAIIHKI